MNRKFNHVLSSSLDTDASAPQQMSLFPEEKSGKDLERMKIKSLLKSIYKTADNNVTAERVDW